jgi:hypothetical protein
MIRVYRRAASGSFVIKGSVHIDVVLVVDTVVVIISRARVPRRGGGRAKRGGRQ